MLQAKCRNFLRKLWMTVFDFPIQNFTNFHNNEMFAGNSSPTLKAIHYGSAIWSVFGWECNEANALLNFLTGSAARSITRLFT